MPPSLYESHSFLYHVATLLFSHSSSISIFIFISQMADFIDHIESYIVFASSPSINNSAAPSSSSSSSSVRNDTSQSSSFSVPNPSGAGAGVPSLSELNNLEPISWSSQGGYDHPQPGSRLLQYGTYRPYHLTCFSWNVPLFDFIHFLFFSI